MLHVDDNPEFLELASEFLESEGNSITVISETDASVALEKIDDVDCVLSDYSMESMEGLELLDEVREKRPKLPFILFTGKGSEEVASEAISRGVTDYIQKKRGRDRYALLSKRIENAVARHNAEESLRESERRFRRLIEESSDLITIVDSEGEIKYESPSIESILGYEPEELVGENAFDYVHPEDADEIVEAFESIVDEPGETAVIEYRFKAKDGSWRWLESNTRNLLHDPVVEGIVGNSRDVTERKERERQLARYRNLVENVGDAMYVLDEEGYIEMVNASMLDEFGYSEEEIIGSHVLEFMRPEDVEKGTEIITQLLKQDEDRQRRWGTFELVLETVDGERRIYEDNLAVLTGDNGEYLGSVGVIRDITERKQREQRLNVLNRVLRHDLRNYMNLISGYAELLLKAETEPDRQKKLESIREKALEMTDLSEQARHIEKTLAKDRNPREKTDIDEVVEDTIRTVEEEHDVKIGVETRSGEVYASELIDIALENVIENAVEHGSPNESDPGITVSVTESEDEEYIEVRVADQGPGIPEKEREVVEKGEETQLHHASGLGLWLVNWIVTESGGELKFEENQPTGTVVIIRLRKVD